MRVLVATRPVDFRKGMDGLAALAKETLAQNPFSGAILVFRAKRADRVKLLFWDGSWIDAGEQAARTRCVQMAADHGRGDAAVARRNLRR